MLKGSNTGTEKFLTSLLSRLEFDVALNTSSLHSLKLDLNWRKKAADAMVPSSKIKVCYVSGYPLPF